MGMRPGLRVLRGLALAGSASGEGGEAFTGGSDEEGDASCWR